MLNESVVNQIKELIVEAGSMAAHHHGSKLDIKIKDDNSPVTNIDKLLSKYIVEHLNLIVPNIPVISEEEELIEYGDIFFLIDPIDGTRSYIKGDDDYTVNIGLIDGGIPVYGFIYQPAKELLYYTDHNKKLVIESCGIAKSNNHNHNHKEHQNAKKCVVTISHRSTKSKPTQDFITKYATEVVQVSSSVKLCMIASGEADLYPRFGTTMEWDTAAGHALILAAGGDVVSMDGTRMKYGKPDLRNSDFVAYGTSHIFHPVV